MFERLAQRLRAYAERDGRGYPDWAVRYVPVVRRLQQEGRLTGRPIEIGANENGLARFAGMRTVVVDAAFEHLRAARATQDVLPVVADITALPFRDGAADVCVCVDTLEHVPAGSRQPAVAEVLRIVGAAGTAVLAFPSGRKAAQAESSVRNAYVRWTGRNLKWLEEHAAEGLPSPGALAALVRVEAGDRKRLDVTGNANLRVWRWMWLVLLCGWPGRGNAVFQALLRFFTPILCRMHFGTCYRTVLWVEPKDV